MAGLQEIDDHLIERAAAVCEDLITFFDAWGHHSDSHKVLLRNTHKLLTCMHNAYNPLRLTPTQLKNCKNGLRAMAPFFKELRDIKLTVTLFPPDSHIQDPKNPHSLSQFVILRLEDILELITCLSKPCTRALQLPIACTVENPLFKQQLDAIFYIWPPDDHAFKALEVKDYHELMPFISRQTEALDKYALGTGSHILESRLLRDWIGSMNSKVLWLVGPEGTGKTVLASVIVDALQVKLPSSGFGIACAFLQPQDLEQSAMLILRQLLHQLAEQTVGDLVREIRNDINNPRIADFKLCYDLKKVVSAFNRVYLILDAMDTKAGLNLLTNDSFLSHLKDTAVWILLTSRMAPRPGLFDTAPVLKVQPDQDIVSTVIQQEIERKPHLHQMCWVTPGLKEKILDKLVQGASRSFTLPLVNLEYLSTKSTVIELLDALLSMPDTAGKAYQKLLVSALVDQPPSGRELAKGAMFWLCYGRRDLSEKELTEGMAVLRHSKEERNLLNSDFRDSALAHVTNGMAKFEPLHLSTMTSFNFNYPVARLAYHTSQPEFRAQLQQYLPHGHTRAAQACLRYMSLTYSTAKVTQTAVTTPFLPYAIQFWNEHASYGDQLALKEDIYAFFGNAGLIAWVFDTWQRGLSSSSIIRGWQKKLPLHLPLAGNLPPLDLATLFGLPKIVESLLQTGADSLRTFPDFSPLLHFAAVQDNPEIIRHLVQAKVPLAALDKSGQGALHYAAQRGIYDNMRCLLEAGSSVDARDSNGNTALNFVAMIGSWKSIGLLVRHGATNNADNDGRTALHAACMNCHGFTASVLIMEFGEVNARDRQNRTPLHAAIFNGHTKVVSTLITHGADLEACDDKSRTPLMYAVTTTSVDRVKIVESLVKAGANVEARCKKTGQRAVDMARDAQAQSMMSRQCLDDILEALRLQAS